MDVFEPVGNSGNSGSKSKESQSHLPARKRRRKRKEMLNFTERGESSSGKSSGSEIGGDNVGGECASVCVVGRGSGSRAESDRGRGRASRGESGRGRERGSRGRASRGRASRGRASRGRVIRGRAARGRSGRGRAKANENAEEELEKPNEGYHEVSDDEIDIPPFTPLREQRIHFDRRILRGVMTRELYFFHLFFTREIISSIATNSNIYATTKVSQKSYCTAYVNKEGLWNETSPAEIEKLIALLIYFGLVRVDTRTENYWSTKTIYHGLWARKIMSRDCYKSLMAFLHVVDPTIEIPGEKLCKIATLLSQFKDRCKILYQPTQNLAVDERMVKSKHRSGMRQYMKDKPTKWGIHCRFQCIHR